MAAPVVTWFSPAALSGLALALFAAALAVLVAAGRAGRRRRFLVAAAAGGVTFQLVHFAEHVAQMAYWFGHTAEEAWLTPWAGVTRDGLAYWCQVLPGKGIASARGSELLHLMGNVVFLLGAVALYRLVVRERSDGRALARWCLRVQGFHVAEHVVLTTTLFLTGTARGFSTAFGIIDPASQEAVAYRLLFHFLLDLAVTIYAVAAARASARRTLVPLRPKVVVVAPLPP